MDDGLGIRGIPPINNDPSRNRNRKKPGKGSFSLDGDDEENGPPSPRPKKEQKEKLEKKPSIKRPDDGGIDILI